MWITKTVLVSGIANNVEGLIKFDGGRKRLVVAPITTATTTIDLVVEVGEGVIGTSRAWL